MKAPKRPPKMSALISVLLLLLAGISPLLQSKAHAKPVTPIQFGDPTDTDEGPLPGPPKSSNKDLSSTFRQQSLAATPSSTGGQPSLLNMADRYWLLASILKYWR
jgi:hypothetical protein